MKYRKAQVVPSGAQVAGFVALIALFIILYIILLPDSEKEKLIGVDFEDEDGVSSSDGGEGKVFRILLSETPGSLSPLEEEEVEQNLAAINLFSGTEKGVQSLANLLTISRSVFQNKQQVLSFKLENLNNVEKVSLLFFISESKGEIILKLNGNEFYRGKLSSGDLPIELPKALLTIDNKVELIASNPGIFFLSVNKYLLRDVKLITEYNIQNKKEQRSFVLSSSEMEGLEKIELNYFVNCIEVSERGTLRINVNGHSVDTYLVGCDAGEVNLEISKKYLVEGRNAIEFEIDKGNYVLEQVVLAKKLEKKGFPKYFFEIKKEEFEDVEDNNLNVELEFSFRDEGRKRATILVNGERFYLDSYGERYSKDISELAVRGENYIKIIPKNEFEVENLEIWLED